MAGLFICLWGLFTAIFLYFRLRATQAHGQKLSLCPEFQPPPVTVVLPVKGINSFSESCFRAWLTQDYPADVDTVFSLQDKHDPALALLVTLKQEFSFRITVNPVESGFSGKMSNLLKGLQLGKHETIVMADSDTLPKPEILRHLARRLAKGAHFATCLPVGTFPKSFWERVSQEFFSIAYYLLFPARMREFHQPWLYGACIATTKATLTSIGGIERFKDSVSEDLAMSFQARELGKKISLAGTLSCPIGESEFSQLWHRFTRCNIINLFIAPFGASTTLLKTIFLTSYLPLGIIGSITKDRALLTTTFCIFLVRVTLSGISWKDWRFACPPFLSVLMCDLLNLVSMFYGALFRRINWRGVICRVSLAGKLLPVTQRRVFTTEVHDEGRVA